jgi:hypothetical protein
MTLTLDNANADAALAHLLGECWEHCPYCARRVEHPNIAPVEVIDDVRYVQKVGANGLDTLAATWLAIDGWTYQAARISTAEYRIVCSEPEPCELPAIDCGIIAVEDLLDVITHGRCVRMAS